MTVTTTGEAASPFRPVPRTGVIYVMAEAAERGFAYGAPGWTNLGQGAPETGPIPGAAPRINQMVLDDRTHEYSPVLGMGELRDAVAALYNERYRSGLPSQYTRENVAISSGGRAGLTRLVAALGSIHLGHFLPDYTAYEELLASFQGFVPIPIVLEREAGFALPPEALRKEIVARGLGALLLSNPCNPTGHVVGPADLELWVETCRELRCCLMVDEFYSHYLYGRNETPACHSACSYVEDVNRDPVVILDGLTKNWRYPGWRLSWTVGPRDVIERVGSAGSFLDGGPPHPIQRAALPLLERSTADQEASAIQAHFGHKRTVLLDGAQQLGLKIEPGPAGAFYAFASLENMPPALQDGMDFFRRALEHQVIVVPGEFFDVNPGKRRSHIPSRLKQFIRISFGPSESEVREGLSRLGQMIAAQGQV